MLYMLRALPLHSCTLDVDAASSACFIAVVCKNKSISCVAESRMSMTVPVYDRLSLASRS